MVFIGILICAAVSLAPGGHALLAVALFVGGIVLCCRWMGVRRAFALFGFVDLLLLSPVVSTSGPLPRAAYALAVFAASVAVMMTHRCFPDWLLPLRGRWARKFWASAALAGLVSVTFVSGMLEVAAVDFRAGWIVLVVLPPLILYLWPAWDVLVHGWDPHTDSAAAG